MAEDLFLGDGLVVAEGGAGGTSLALSHHVKLARAAEPGAIHVRLQPPEG